jgi:hypothetical protein
MSSHFLPTSRHFISTVRNFLPPLQIPTPQQYKNASHSMNRCS